jgi:sugar porter (SP) family MFS transporter
MITPTATERSTRRAELNLTYIWLISAAAALGGLLFGWDWVVIGGAKAFFEPFFGIARDAVADGKTTIVTDETLSGWANSCALLGCLAGSLATGVLSDKFGRKRLLIFAALLFAVSSVLTGWAGTFHQFIAWRIAGGVAIGMASNLSPLYIAEIAPAQMRGRLVALNQFAIVIGILAAQLLNVLIAQRIPDGATAAMVAQSWNGQYGWRWMFTLVALPSLLFFVCSVFVPESPRWLVKGGAADRAQKILSRIGGNVYAAAETESIRQTIAAEEVSRVRIADLFAPKLLKILLIGCGLAVLQQWSGINILFNYAQNIFASKVGVNTTLLFSVMIGVVNVAFTIIGLGTVDRWGRRKLMLFGSAGIAMAHALTGLAYAANLKGTAMLVFVLAAIGCYAMSLAPVTWVIISEIFPNRIRGTAISVATSTLWIACFILTYTFPWLEGTIGTGNTFWIYSGICLAGLLFVFLKLPETKDKSLEQIERELAD